MLNYFRKYTITKTVATVFAFSLVLSLLIAYSQIFPSNPTNLGNPIRVTKPKKIPPTEVPLATISAPPAYQVSGGTYAFQTFNNCGPASLSMLLSFYDIYVSQKELGDELRPWQNPGGNNDDKSVTLPELAGKAEDFGFIAYHRPNGDIETLKNFIANDMPVVTRTITKLGEDIGHYRVVYGYNDSTGQIIQNDSLQGAGLRFNYDDFLSIWKPYGYEYLVLVPNDKKDLAERLLGENADEVASWTNAITRLKDEITQYPKDPFLKFSLSVAYYNIGEYRKSIEEFEKVESQLPFRTLWYQIEPLLAYQKLGRYEEVLPRIEKVLNGGNRAFSELYQVRGEIYLAQGNLQKAKNEFEFALFYNENFSQAFMSLNNLNNSF